MVPPERVCYFFFMAESEPAVRAAGPEDRARAIDTIVLGFAADPFCRWLWPEPRDYLAAMGRLVPAFGGRAFDAGTALVSEDFAAAALWLPPGIEPDQEAMAQIVFETVRPEIHEEVGAMMEGVEAVHPDEPVWYLPLIAADPLHVGKGHGGALMRRALERCDAGGETAWLESSNPRNISLYLRHGFEIVGEVQVGSAPVMTPMIRRPRG